MKTSESMAVPVYNFYTIKVRSTYVQIQNNYSAISEVILRASDTLINSVISLRRLDISNFLSTTMFFYPQTPWGLKAKVNFIFNQNLRDFYPVLRFLAKTAFPVTLNPLNPFRQKKGR